MNNHDDDAPNEKRQPDGSDIGPEPDWLGEDTAAAEEPIAAAPPRAQASIDVPQPVAVSSEIVPEPQPRVRRDRPWMWALVPLIALLVTAGVAWLGTTRGLHDITTYGALRQEDASLLPARWSLLLWWIVLPLLGVFVVYGLLPAGREVTRIKLSGPLLTVALAGSSLWIFAQHWGWDEVAVISSFAASIACIVAYLLVSVGPHITSMWRRLLAIFPLSAAVAYSVMLSLVSWQGYSSQPFGDRATSLLFLLLLLVAAAVFAFFLKDGAVGLVLAIWFIGVTQSQWSDDKVVSISAIIAALLAAATAVLGTLVAAESQRPSFTTSMPPKRSRISFFRKSPDSSSQELP